MSPQVVGSRCFATLRFCFYVAAAVIVALVAVVLGVRENEALRHGRGIDVPEGLLGKNVFITGSTSGIGFTTAVRLCTMGAHVVVHGPDEHRTQRAAREVQQRADSRGGWGSGTATPLAARLDDFAAVHRLSLQTKEVFPHVDLLILNAAINYGGAPAFGPAMQRIMESHPPGFFVGQSGLDRVMSTNHFGHFLLTMLLLPRLAPEARIVVVTGQGMWQGDWRRLVTPQRIEWEKHRKLAYLAYEDSKFANLCFGRALRQRVGASRTVIVHDPGQIRTTMVQDRGSEVYKSRWFLRAPPDRKWRWWHMTADQAAERMVEAAFVTRRPVPDVVYSYWMPRGIFQRLAHHSLVVLRNYWRQKLPVYTLMYQAFSFGPLYDGIGPQCGDPSFLAYYWNYSLNATGLGKYVDHKSFLAYYNAHLAKPLAALQR